jgi:hypothetical protein
MRNYSLSILSIALLLILGSFQAWADDKVQTVESVGSGLTKGQAKADAIRSAVQKVVGGFVSSDLIMKNDEIIKDEVLMFSAGYVDKVVVVSENFSSDNTYKVRIRADVVSQRVQRKLEELNIATKSIDTQSLFAEALTKMDQRDNTQTLFKKVLNNFYERAFVTEVVGAPRMVIGNGDDVQLYIMVKASYNKTYAAELKSTIIGATTPSSVTNSKDAYEYSEGDTRLVCFSDVSETGRPPSEILEQRKKIIDAPFEFDMAPYASYDDRRILPFLTDQLLDTSEIPLSCGQVSKLTKLVKNISSGSVYDKSVSIKGVPHIVLLLKDASGNILASGDGAFMGGDDPGLGRYGYSTAEFINKDTSHLFFAFGKTDYRFIPVNITRSRLAQVKKIESFVKDPLKNPKADYGIYHSSY